MPEPHQRLSPLSRVAAARGRGGPCLATLAAECGLEVDSLRKALAHGRNPSLATALRVAAALDLEVEQLFEELHVGAQCDPGAAAGAADPRLPHPAAAR